MPSESNDYAIVIGVNHYVTGALKPLSKALADAGAIEKWLLDTTTGGGLPRDNCETILSESSGTPAFDRIDGAFFDILEKARPNSAARRLYFYFSGHGMAASELRTFLCLPLWSGRRPSMALDSQDFWLAVAGEGVFKEIVCLFDCCRSFTPNVGGLTSSMSRARPESSAAKTHFFMGFAAEFLQQAFEDDVNDHGFFTRALLSGLQGGACHPAGGAPASRLKSFLETETIRLAQLAGKKQTPTVYNGFSTLNEPIFGSALPLGTGQEGLRYAVNVTEKPGRAVHLVDPEDIETPWNGAQPWRFALKAGLHILHDKSDGKMLRLPRDSTQGEIHVAF